MANRVILDIQSCLSDTTRSKWLVKLSQFYEPIGEAILKIAMTNCKTGKSN